MLQPMLKFWTETSISTTLLLMVPLQLSTSSWKHIIFIIMLCCSSLRNLWKYIPLKYCTSKNFTRDYIFKVWKKVNNLTIIDSAEESFENELRKCLAHIPRPTVANPLLQIHRNLEKCIPISYKAELAIMLQESLWNNFYFLNVLLTKHISE